MKFIATILFGLFSSFSSQIFGQSSPEALGKSLINCFQGDSISQLKKHFPSADQLLVYAEKHNMELNDEKISALKENYPMLIIELNSKLIDLQKDGLKKGIEWKMIQTDSIRTSLKKSPNANMENDSIEINRVDIDLHYRSNNYRLVLENTIEIDGKWYLDNKIYFREMNED
jgi:hypothetical protein